MPPRPCLCAIRSIGTIYGRPTRITLSGMTVILVRNRINIFPNLETGECYVREHQQENDKPPFTHRAWIKRTELIRKGRHIGVWIDEGSARIEQNGDVHWLQLHSLPIGGFDG